MSDKKSQSNSGKGKRRSKGSSSRKNLYEKRERLLEEMQSTDDERAISVREQVEKLKAGGGDVDDEDKWGDRKSRRKGSPWMLWAILGLAIPILLVGLILMSKNGSGRKGETAGEMGLDFNTLNGVGKSSPEDWFVKNSGKAFSRGSEILEDLDNESLTLGEVEPLVRSSGQAERLMAMFDEGTWSAFDTSKSTNFAWGYGSSNEIGYMFLEGVRRDFRNFRAYFVRAGDDIVIDVDATEAESTIPVGELTGKTLADDALTRCWIAKQPSYDARSDKEIYSWYQILGADTVDFVWAYCKTGSAIDEILKKELNYGRAIGERIEYARMTLLLGNAAQFRDDEFVIKEVLANEWVLPEAE